MSTGALLVRVSAGFAAVLLGLAGLLALPLVTRVSPGTATFSFGAIVGSVTLVIIAAGLIRPRPYAWLVATFGALAGSAAGLLVERAGGCCMYRFTVHRGFPLAWHHRGQDFTGVVPDDQALAVVTGRPGSGAGEAIAARVGGVTDSVDEQYLLADVAFWFGVVLTVIVIAGLVVGLRGRARH